MDLFGEYPFPDVEDIAGWQDIKSHYDRVSQTVGFSIDPPNLVLTQAGHHLTEIGEHDAALEVLHNLVDIHPHSLDGPWQLANLHRTMGDTTTAIRYYEECLRREPNMVPARTWLERLRPER
jgi:tetratricopeptide (TPR) repeat protein